MTSESEKKPKSSKSSSSRSDTFAHYTAWLANYPVLTMEETCKLNVARKEGCQKSREKMILSNLLLVISMAIKYGHLGMCVKDLVSEGSIGLMKAVDRYDPSKGCLTTYASWWIKQRIRRALSNQARTIRVPIHALEKMKLLRTTHDSVMLELGRCPTVDDIVCATGLEGAKVEELMRIDPQMVSISSSTGDDESESTVGDTIADENAVHPFDHCVKQQRLNFLSEAVSILTAREREVITLRFGLRDGQEKTLDAIGKHFGLTRERARQIEAIALAKMQRLATNRQKQEQRREEECYSNLSN